MEEEDQTPWFLICVHSPEGLEHWFATDEDLISDLRGYKGYVYADESFIEMFMKTASEGEIMRFSKGIIVRTTASHMKIDTMDQR